MAFTAGYGQGATFKLAGAMAATVLNITEWDWAEEVEKLIATHTGTAGIQAVIAGVLSGDCTVTANVDAAALPSATPPTIKAGSKGLITLAVGSAMPFSIPVMIVKVNYKSSIGTLVNYNFSVTLDTLSGTYAYPT